ncbi:PREDICTED: disease resistance protein RGA2-like [Nelumbo nucifera]|uniref:Disease resistance protein RGA2-like n=2 Tax=Nelumbo nucifera TaxID=4432 RepID=A0A1U8BPV9_NELNU|nr:PREDICTED: disease resistance protein RGA2-like [Nelumbo nucifera]DAD42472.1 TPA_asm: hypothetical protein HUJ06_000702 [Nelumbo nucifera]
MEAAVLCAFVEKLFGSLKSLVVQEYGLTTSVKKELEKLESTVSTIEAVLEDVEEKQLNSKAIGDFLWKLKDALDDADDVLDEFSTKVLRRREERRVLNKVRKFLSSSKQIIFRHHIGHEIKNVMERFVGIAAEKSKFHLTEGIISKNYESEERQRETTSIVLESEVYGRDDDKEKVVELLVDKFNENGISVIPIVGIEGLGKTTLAQLVYNDGRVKSLFELRMWIYVSDDFNVEKLTKQIIESATKRKCDVPNKDLLQRRLQEELNGRRYLLILDDVNNEDSEKWEELKKVLMSGARGSTIIVTSPSTKVARIMGTVDPYHLSFLSNDDCWELFRRRAFGVEEVPCNLVAIGKEIVRKCRGLPLAAKALGGLMRSKREEREWLYVRDHGDLLEDATGILPALKLSYDHLAPHLKQCFAYCALFPQDYRINKQTLIQLWIAEGFIQSSITGKEVEDIGNEYFSELVQRSFFQYAWEDEYGNFEWCKMHDLVHDLARFVGRTEWRMISITDNGPSSTGKGKRRVRHLSLDYGKSWLQGVQRINCNPFFHNEELKAARTLLVLNNRHGYVLQNLSSTLSYFKRLRVLSLGGMEIEKLPTSIDKLEHLRYLDISETRITKLPSSLASLLNLQTLKISNINQVVKLPKGLTKLINLRHLEFNKFSKEVQIPRRIGRLTGLQALSRFIVGEESGRSLTELQGLNNLRGEIIIKNLENVRNAGEAEGANLKSKPNLCSLWLFWSLKNDDRDSRSSRGGGNLGEEVFECICMQPHPNLRRLKVYGYPGRQTPGWMTKGNLSMPNLVEIQLWKCRKLEYVTALGHLPCLKTLGLYHMDSIRYMMDGSINTNHKGIGIAGGVPDEVVIFPSLTVLEIWNMPRMEGWLSGKEEEEEGTTPLLLLEDFVVVVQFPRLERLSIHSCPRLTSMPRLSTSSLKSLTLHRSNDMILTSLHKLSTTVSDCLTSFGSSLQHLTALHTLCIESAYEIVCLPESIQHLTKLDTLQISNCSKLECLPEWIHNLPSLRQLKLSYNPNLRNLPAALQRLHSLQTLQIRKCPQLERRCSKDRGEDWHKIAHIPHIQIIQY